MIGFFKPLSHAAATLFAMTLLSATVPAAAQTFTPLYQFPQDSSGHTGIVLPGLMVQGRDGKLYGTIDDDGPLGDGSAFAFTPTGTFARIYAFCSQTACHDGTHPAGGLTLGNAGKFYGAAQNGGATGDGSLFSLTASGTFAKLHDFTSGVDGGYPVYPPFQTANGKIYGAGSEVYSGDYGSIYELSGTSHPPTFSILTDFDYTDGNSPNMPVLAADGNLYGTTSSGGDPTCRCGVIYKLTPAKKLTVIHTFKGYPNDGNEPLGALSIGHDGDFYGTTYNGGLLNVGSAFKIARTGKFTLLHSFQPSIDGSHPASGFAHGSDGNFYGDAAGGAYGAGFLYKMTPAGALTKLYDFCPPHACVAYYAQTPLVQHTNGKFYGNTSGNSLGGSYFYSLDVGLAPFVKVSRPAARPGEVVEILGQDFDGATRVAFNGVPARFEVGSDGCLTAMVPPGATSGLVTVRTRGGVLASERGFVVTR